MKKNYSMRPAIYDMKVGEELSFPIEKLRSIRTLASELGAIFDREYSTHTDRIQRTITVVRAR